ncbi:MULTISPECIES: trypsin-like serine protease [unclassified Streptomyces]|uniref:trypsin-like serine protease n=1 Tax=unclassified Streptomyces TaxID=2593676 RepID=UPI001E46CD8A|nr:trypsin-like serine protease [Streptomyces sp. CB02980]MCB8908255.1 trypsin-like serine protease [Streptomyces sp. CB02980]
MSTARLCTAAATSLVALALAVGVSSIPAGAISGATAPSTSYTFTAKLEIGSSEATRRNCTGVLVNPRWVLTASTCFTRGLTPLEAGPVPEKAVVTVGRNNLTTATGLITEVTEVVPYQGRDLVLARLKKPAFGVTPATPTATAVTAGETLKSAGFGQTTADWVPYNLHTGNFTVDAANGPTLDITGQSGAAVCDGDAGGPLLREKDGKTELVGVNSRSWKGGCFGTAATETRTGAQSVNVSDTSARTWLKAEREFVQMADANADGLDDMIIQNLNGDITVRLAVKGVLGSGNPLYRFHEGNLWSSGWANFIGQEGKGRLYFADINADNKAEMIVHALDGSIAVRPNLGDGWGSSVTWSSGWANFLGHEGQGRLYFADANADNKADMIVHSAADGTVAVRPNLGTGFGSSVTWSSGWANLLGHEGQGRLSFADMNGDKKADMVVQAADGTVAVRPNLGAGWGSSVTWSSGWANFLGHAGQGHLYFADSVNNGGTSDGKADLIVHSTDGKLALRENTGAAFAIVTGDDWV